jgi:hypothetical protein
MTSFISFADVPDHATPPRRARPGSRATTSPPDAPHSATTSPSCVQRVCGITRKRRLMRSQGCGHRSRCLAKDYFFPLGRSEMMKKNARPPCTRSMLPITSNSGAICCWA